MRSEQVLTSYTLSSVAYHILQQRFDTQFAWVLGGANQTLQGTLLFHGNVVKVV